MPRVFDKSIHKPMATAIVMVAALAGCGASPPKQFRIDANHFTPCAHAPHCVSSQAEPSDAHYVRPLAYHGSARQAKQTLMAVLRGEDNARIVSAKGHFVHATFTTTLGFVDDVTFIIQPAAAVIDVKSSSRIGYYDFGVNRDRVARIRKAFEARLAAAR
ncbi:DUF1499 domain-containing protein [Salinisphaera hydrothermalis]|uniref:Lipoprotein n=1 Tax=Salinisphaera hydrothermalis (strain C41B8) TaxID=1304275 RepID=A0A084II37_SALHC|nr:DUF1499 domain-containing protein [Salinisphaera hydrothermalis]KEZ76371.1 hypothetical protein C41B8_15195 [Salinisphaera hydrothermalis C41B8]